MAARRLVNDTEGVHVVLAGTMVAGAETAAELGLPRPGTRQLDAGTGREWRTVIVTPNRTERHSELGDVRMRLHRAHGWQELPLHVIRKLEELARQSGEVTPP
jgi:hypothetical protein